MSACIDDDVQVRRSQTSLNPRLKLFMGTFHVAIIYIVDSYNVAEPLGVYRLGDTYPPRPMNATLGLSLGEVFWETTWLLVGAQGFSAHRIQRPVWRLTPVYDC
jgi:hypothetical protein